MTPIQWYFHYKEIKRFQASEEDNKIIPLYKGIRNSVLFAASCANLDRARPYIEEIRKREAQADPNSVISDKDKEDLAIMQASPEEVEISIPKFTEIQTDERLRELTKKYMAKLQVYDSKEQKKEADE